MFYWFRIHFALSIVYVIEIVVCNEKCGCRKLCIIIEKQREHRANCSEVVLIIKNGGKLIVGICWLGKSTFNIYCVFSFQNISALWCENDRNCSKIRYNIKRLAKILFLGRKLSFFERLFVYSASYVSPTPLSITVQLYTVKILCSWVECISAIFTWKCSCIVESALVLDKYYQHWAFDRYKL